MKSLMLILFLSFSTFATEFPSGDWEKMYEEIHGNGVYQTSDHWLATRKANAFAADSQDLDGLAERTNMALRGIFKIATMNLKRYGYANDAGEIQAGWRLHDGELQTLVIIGARDIGDFKPLSDWLAQAYNKIEAKLGYQLCHTLRLDDIKTFNYAIPVVFRPCTYGEHEFTCHFCGDTHCGPSSHPARGLAPATSYWVTSITCSIATYGAGYFFICSPIAMLVEWVVDNKIAPALEPKIYEWACK